MKKTRDRFKRLIEAHSEARVSGGKVQARCVGGGNHSQSMAGVYTSLVMFSCCACLTARLCTSPRLPEIVYAAGLDLDVLLIGCQLPPVAKA